MVDNGHGVVVELNPGASKLELVVCLRSAAIRVAPKKIGIRVRVRVQIKLASGSGFKNNYEPGFLNPDRSMTRCSASEIVVSS